MKRLVRQLIESNVLRLSALALSVAGALFSGTAAVFAQEKAKVEIRNVEVIERTASVAEIQAKHKGEAANADWTYSVQPFFNLEPLSGKSDPFTGRYTETVKVAHLDVKVGLKLIILLPPDKTARLVTHEHAHQALCERLLKEYVSLVQEAADKTMGQTFTGVGASPAAAIAAVGQKIGNSVSKPFMDKVDSLAPKLNAIFDRITDHSIKSIDAKEAEELAWTEFKEGGSPASVVTQGSSSAYGSSAAAGSSALSGAGSPYGANVASPTSPSSTANPSTVSGSGPPATSPGSSPYGSGVNSTAPSSLGSSPYGSYVAPAPSSQNSVPKSKSGGVGSSPYGNGF